MQEISIGSLSIDHFGALIGKRGAHEMRERASRARTAFDGRRIWNINSTATGGGVAEMLQTLLAYGRGCGVDVRWLVIEGDTGFFTITKRLHNWLHGTPGDAGPLGGQERAHYEEVAARNEAQMPAAVRPGDVVVLHDPQTAGLVPAMRRLGAVVVWRCHVGNDHSNRWMEDAWGFLRPYLDEAHAFVFSRQAYVPGWLCGRLVRIITPSIDAFSAKNRPLSRAAARTILTHIGLLAGETAGGEPLYTRLDGSVARVHHRAEVIHAGSLPGSKTRLVVQVSRWDRLKDMMGVMRGFVEHVNPSTPAHLVLAGPDVRGVTDDPEGNEVLEECIAAWRCLPPHTRSRVLLACLPMADVEENAAMVNALQRHARVIAQKSLHEGFGLTVTEAMWKGRPVVASAVGGMRDQIKDGRHGLLIEDPTDLRAFGAALQRLLDDPALARRLGRNARRRVLVHFLPPRHLTRYADLIELMRVRPSAGALLADAWISPSPNGQGPPQRYPAGAGVAASAVEGSSSSKP